MWKMLKKNGYELYNSDICNLKLLDNGEKYDVYVNYKGYNVVMPLELWEFGDEINERNINYSVEGEKGKFNTFYYSVNKKDTRLFCDMIYFFLLEHNIDGALNDKFKIYNW